MARYYDMAALAEMIRARADILIEGKQALHYIANWLDKLPPADVVPKSEVEALIKENERWMLEYEGFRAGAKQIVETAKSEVAREIFEDIEKMLENQEVVTKNQREKELGDWIFHNYIPRKVAELKKKYTEDKK